MKKKILIIALFFFTVQIFGQEEKSLIEGSIKFNVDFPGTSTITDVYYSDSLSGKQNIELGYGLSMEANIDATDYLAFGFGLTYQFTRFGKLGFPQVDSTSTDAELLAENERNSGKFGYLPLYALAKITFYHSKIIFPSIVAQIGMNLYYGNDAYKGDYLLSGGTYYGLGVSFDIYEYYQVGLLYKTSYGSASHAEEEFYKSKYSFLSLSFGISLK